MPFDVEMPDGTIIEEVPDGTSKEVVLKKWQAMQQAPQGSAVSQAVQNIPKSAGNLVSGIANAVIHPVDTASGLLDAAAGGLQNIFYSAAPSLKPTEDSFFYNKRAEEVADAVGGHYKDRFGGMENLRKTAIQDPVGLMADVAGGAGLLGASLRVSGAARAAGIADKVSKAIDPINMAAKGLTSVAKPAYTWAAGTTSGSGSRAVEKAMEGGEAFTSAMRGKTTETEVLSKARESLDELRNIRSAEYQSKLSNLKSANQKLDIADIKKLADDWLSRYNVKKGKKGLDFSRSTVTGKGVEEVKGVYDMIQDWGSKPEDLTPANLDILKRRVGAFYAQDRQSRAMVSGLERAVKEKIAKAVPEYAEMTKGYAKSSQVIKEIEHALGLGTRTAADTALRKMLTAIREDKTFRRDLLETLGKAGAEDLTGAASGLIMKSPWSQRLGPMLTVTGTGVAAVLSNPWLAPLLATASPRVVGEFSKLLGNVGRASSKARGAALAAYQAGNLPLQE